MQGEFLSPLGRVTAEDDVHEFRRVWKTLYIQFISLIILLVLLLSISVGKRRVQGLAETDTLE
jgi:hypothetical protein